MYSRGHFGFNDFRGQDFLASLQKREECILGNKVITKKWAKNFI